ncbi:hypothetical protein RBB77_00330 [Tunturibacter psychrotolerans]|uniref:Zinc-finger domain-containing protein n=1 Tax=Tunturiibacter psychrotolerans TaxID=3069686 RepID=A0AAU7ZR09_9BACT
MKHFAEEDLISYQLHESSNEAAIRRHLEGCVECAAMSESIAETLRVFSAEPVPKLDLERNWQRLRGNLSALATDQPKRLRLRWKLIWPAIGLAMAALLLVVFIALHGSHAMKTRRNLAINGHGPLTMEPRDPAIADHLDSAERLLTEVNNTHGPLDEATREQAHHLLLKNAVYVHAARESGEVAQAAVLENLGRVLTTLDNEPETSHSTWRLRLEMNTSGLLLDIRILRQNDDQNQGAAQ